MHVPPRVHPMWPVSLPPREGELQGLAKVKEVLEKDQGVFTDKDVNRLADRCIVLIDPRRHLIPSNVHRFAKSVNAWPSITLPIKFHALGNVIVTVLKTPADREALWNRCQQHAEFRNFAENADHKLTLETAAECVFAAGSQLTVQNAEKRPHANRGTHTRVKDEQL